MSWCRWLLVRFASPPVGIGPEGTDTDVVGVQNAALQKSQEELQEKVASLQDDTESLQRDVQESKRQAQQQVRQPILHRYTLDRWQGLAWAAAGTTGQTCAAPLVKQGCSAAICAGFSAQILLSCRLWCST